MRNNVAVVIVPSGLTEHGFQPLADVDSIIEEIQMRDNYVGPVLEEILHAGHDHEQMNWDS
ncbi:MAG: hypothetical protein WDN00_02120 [Limisphaerales bacterium]